MKLFGQHRPSLAAQASLWLARRDSGFSATEQAEFERWRTADPRHAEVVAELEAAWTVLDRPRATGRVEQVRREVRALDRRRRHRRVFGAAAVLSAACVAVIIWQPIRQSGALAPAVAASSVKIAAPERRSLPDGSIMEVNTGGRVEVDFRADLRRVRLAGGEAYFEVAKDSARPFVVEAGGVGVRAIGTGFAVRIAPGNVEVVVTQGVVAVEQERRSGDGGERSIGDASPPSVNATDVQPGSPPADSADSASVLVVEAGNRVVVPSAAGDSLPALAAVPMSAGEIERRLAWRWPRLEFTDTSLGEAVALFNERNRVQLHGDARTLASFRVTGVFRADNVEGFVALLESGFGMEAEHRGENTIILRQPD